MKRFIFILLLLSSLLYSANIVKNVKKPDLMVTFVDVGQGDGAVIRNLKNNKVVVVDTGTRNGKIYKYLQSKKIEIIDLLILTHPHSDHIGYAKKLISKMKVKKVLDSGYPHPSKTYERVLETVKEKKIPYVLAIDGQNLNLGNGMILKVLAPEKPFLEGTRSDANTNSVVFILEYKNSKYYFAADSEDETEEMILNNHNNLKVDVLKVAHHGSRYATSDHFLNETSPKIAIISAGKGNSYGHPSEKVITQFDERNIKTYITFEVGTIETFTDGKNISVNTLGIKSLDSNEKEERAELYTVAHNDLDNYQEMKKDGIPVLFKDKKPIILKGHYYSSKKSNLFYPSSCKKELNKIKRKGMIIFSSYELAKNSGRKLSDNCKEVKNKKIPKNNLKYNSRYFPRLQGVNSLIAPRCRCQNFNNICRVDDTLERILFYENLQNKSVEVNNNKININTASLLTLVTLKGIGKSKAKKIISYREKHGDFKHVGHIRRIKGIGNGIYKKIRDEITIGDNHEEENRKIVRKIVKKDAKKDTKKDLSKKININTGSLFNLMKLKGVGKGTAQKIIDYRDKHGDFKHIAHIRRVKGIGNGKYKKIKDFITIK